MEFMQQQERYILSLNSGSSSLKFALYSLGRAETLLATGAVERISLEGGRLWLKNGQGQVLEDMHTAFPHHHQAVEAMFTALETHHLPMPEAVGHRLVHGGPEHEVPQRITPDLVTRLKQLIPFAPLHLPDEIKAIQAVRHHYAALPQVACFDTAFHRRMPAVAQRLPLSRWLWHEGVHRYGFHGLSYEYILAALTDAAQGRLIIAHLGSGASMAAVQDGRPLDTTMGFTPLGGLVMATRPGDLDPGLLLYLLQEKGYTPAALTDLLNHRSGLVGISGISPDMKTLLQRRAEEPHAAQAVELFVHQARKHLGAMAAVLNGLDTLVFTGGIGENAPLVRQLICQDLEFLGIHLAIQRNQTNADVISAEGSPATVRVIKTNEELIIARHTAALIKKRGHHDKHIQSL
jgi:acetate kinase